MASTQTFSRFYSLESSSGNTGSDRIDSQVRSGGTQGEFILSDLPASSGSDNQDVLGDTPNDNLQTVHTSNGASRTFTNREYVGQLANGSGVVARSFSAARNEHIYLLYSNDVYEPSQSITFSSAPFALCFAAGTRILTARGEIAVEDLRVGDSAITATGRRRTVTWTGHRHLGTERPMPADQAPVRIRAGAFGQGQPARDLLLSPGHPVLVGAAVDGQGGVLVPVMYLVNGTSIARTGAKRVTYWHVELDAHDILLAEGLPAESFLDSGCRAFFAEASEQALHNPDFVPPGLSGRCRPVVTDGPLVEAERRRLDAVFAEGLTTHCAWSSAERSWLTA